MSRRLAPRTISVVLLALALPTSACGPGSSEAPTRPRRPNVLWLVAEDMNLELGAYGDPLADTPNLDRLAAEGVTFTNAFATSPTCAPSRASLITGTYATSIGAHHMRSSEGGYLPVPPPDVRAFPELLRANGYFAGNVIKLDYQFSGVLFDAPSTNWNEESGSDWIHRADDQPFFLYVTSMRTHEGQLLNAAGPTTTEPSRVVVPPYYPDTPAVRENFAGYYDRIAEMDAQLGAWLDRLDDEGLADDTIVFFFGDNGRGFPRDKRLLYEGGIHEPLIVRWPGHLDPGTTNDELVSFLDFAPTVLALADVPIPESMPGRVFLGDRAEPEPTYVYAARDRTDEAVDRIRAVRDRRFAYLRNHRPDLPYGQSIAYREPLPTLREMHRLHDLGELPALSEWYFAATKPDEELYDVIADPYELTNLAGDPAHADVLARMRAAHDAWVVDTNDLGAIPEPELAEMYWPGGVQPATPEPVFVATSLPDGSVQVAITSPVDGVVFGIAVEGPRESRWTVYSGPVNLEAGWTLHAIAVRYGWSESAEVAFSP